MVLSTVIALGAVAAAVFFKENILAVLPEEFTEKHIDWAAITVASISGSIAVYLSE